jgi:hypothetical protein
MSASHHDFVPEICYLPEHLEVEHQPLHDAVTRTHLRPHQQVAPITAP